MRPHPHRVGVEVAGGGVYDAGARPAAAAGAGVAREVDHAIDQAVGLRRAYLHRRRGRHGDGQLVAVFAAHRIGISIIDHKGTGAAGHEGAVQGGRSIEESPPDGAAGEHRGIAQTEDDIGPGIYRGWHPHLNASRVAEAALQVVEGCEGGIEVVDQLEAARAHRVHAAIGAGQAIDEPAAARWRRREAKLRVAHAEGIIVPGQDRRQVVEGKGFAVGVAAAFVGGREGDRVRAEGKAHRPGDEVGAGRRGSRPAKVPIVADGGREVVVDRGGGGKHGWITAVAEGSYVYLRRAAHGDGVPEKFGATGIRSPVGEEIDPWPRIGDGGGGVVVVRKNVHPQRRVDLPEVVEGSGGRIVDVGDAEGAATVVGGGENVGDGGLKDGDLAGNGTGSALGIAGR